MGRRDVEALLDLGALIDALSAKMADLSAGRATMPDRVAAFVAHQNATGLLDMPSYVPSVGALSSKLVTVFPRTPAAACRSGRP